jgi:hypothetical protein
MPADTVISRVLPVRPGFPAELERAGITDLGRSRYYGPETHKRFRSLHISSCMGPIPGSACLCVTGQLGGFADERHTC